MNPNDNAVPPVPPQPQVPPVSPAPPQPQVVTGGSPQADPMQPSQPAQAWPQPAQPMSQPTVSGPMGPMPPQPQQPFQPINGGAPMSPMMPGSGTNLIKTVVIVVVAVLVLGGGLAYALLGGKKNGSGGSSGNSSQNSGSGSSSAGGTVSTSKSACDLFTSADAQAVLGGSVTPAGVNNIPPTKGAHGTQSACIYDLSGSDGASVTIQLTIGNSASDAKSVLSTVKSTESGSTTAVPGIGDQAYFGNNLLLVQKSNVYLMVAVISSSPSNVQSTETQIANTILGRL